jgi:serine/threonine protein kinase
MELLEGQDLAHAMRAGLGRRELVHVFVQVAETLQLAHDRGIVHRDLKPDNVFLVHDAGDPLFVKLLDFGIAKILHGEGSGGLTETGVILGTPYYMSPEQARAEAVDHRSDVYALGVMMYRAFAGRLPFVADSTMGVLTRHITEAPQPPSQISDVDPVTERMILRCLAKKPAHRYQSMREVAEALRLVPLQPYPQVASGPYPSVRAQAPPAPVQAQSSAYAPSGSPTATVNESTARGVSTTNHATAARGSSAALTVAGGLAMAAIGAAAAFFLLHRPAPGSGTSTLAARAPSVVTTAAASVAPTATTSVAVTASSTARAQPVAAPTTSTTGATAVGKPRGAGAAKPAPAPATKLPRDIRSPFD